MMSLGDDLAARAILKSAITQFPKLLVKNQAKSVEQNNKWYKKNKHLVNNGRKNSTLRIFHPLDENLIQYLIKEFTMQEEIRREQNGEIPSEAQAFMRFFHHVFQNSYFLRGSSHAITSVFGGFHNMNCVSLSDISAYLHGLSPTFPKDLKHYNFKDTEHFRKIAVEVATDLLKRSGFRKIFNTREFESLHNHQHLQHTIADYSSDWFEFREADRQGIANANFLFRQFSLWGNETLKPELITHNLRYNLIEKLRDKDVRTLEQTVIASILNSDFVDKLLKNEGVRTSNMNDKLLLPVLKTGTTLGQVKFEEIKPLDAAFEKEIAWELLKNPVLLRNMKDFDFLIQLDGQPKRLGTISKDFLDNFIIPVKTKIISIFAQSEGQRDPIPLATVLTDITNLAEGEVFSSESVLENGYHLIVKLNPRFDANNDVSHYGLELDYHSEIFCPSLVNQNVFEKGFASFLNIFNDSFPKQVEQFIQTLQFLEKTNSFDVWKSVGRIIIPISLVVFVLSSLILFSFGNLSLYFGNSPNYSATSISIITLLTSLTILGIQFTRPSNPTRFFRLFSQGGFVAGILTVSLVISSFAMYRSKSTLNYDDLVSDPDVLNIDESESAANNELEYPLPIDNESSDSIVVIPHTIIDVVNNDSSFYQSHKLLVNSLNKGKRFKILKVKTITVDDEFKGKTEDNDKDSIKSLYAIVTSFDKSQIKTKESVLTVKVDSLEMKNGSVYEVKCPEQKISVDTSMPSVSIAISLGKIKIPEEPKADEQTEITPREEQKEKRIQSQIDDKPESYVSSYIHAHDY